MLSTRLPDAVPYGLMKPDVMLIGRFGAVSPRRPSVPPETITLAPSPGVGAPVPSENVPSRTSTVTFVHVP